MKRPSTPPADTTPTPAFMQIEGRLVRSLSSETSHVDRRKFWSVQPWVIVAVVVVVTVALMIPGLLLDVRLGF